MSKWARGSRKTAALLAAWTVTSGNSAPPPRHLGEARELLVEELRLRFVRGGEVGPDPGQLEVGVLGAGAGEGDHRLGVAVAEPAHAAVVLDVDARRPALGTGAGRRQRAELLVPDRDLRAGGERRVEVLLGQRAHRQQRHVREAAADLGGLGPGRDREPGRAAGERGGRAGVGAVAVAVGLDHRAELDSLADRRVEVGAVTLDGAERRSGLLPAPWLSRRRARPARRPG